MHKAFVRFGLRIQNLKIKQIARRLWFCRVIDNMLFKATKCQLASNWNLEREERPQLRQLRNASTNTPSTPAGSPHTFPTPNSALLPPPQLYLLYLPL